MTFLQNADFSIFEKSPIEMKHPLVLLLFIGLQLILSSFSKCPQESTIVEVRYGSSFGKCSGFCIQEVSFKKGTATKTLIPHRDKSLTARKCSRDYEEFESLTSKIDMKAFNEMEVTIGCPDCKDEGAEWVQVITTDGIQKKVTYSFGQEPEAFAPFIAELRSYYEEIGMCD